MSSKVVASNHPTQPPMVIKSFLQSQIEVIYSLQYLRDYILTSSLSNLYDKLPKDSNLNLSTNSHKSFIELLKKIIYFQINQDILKEIGTIEFPENIIQKELDTFKNEDYEKLNTFDLLAFICGKFTEYNAKVQYTKSNNFSELENSVQNFTADYLIEQINYNNLKSAKSLIRLFEEDKMTGNKVSNYFEIIAIIFKKENYFFISKDTCEDLLNKDDGTIVKKFFKDKYNLNENEVEELTISTILYKRKENIGEENETNWENEVVFGKMVQSVIIPTGNGEIEENKEENKEDKKVEKPGSEFIVTKTFRRMQSMLRK